MKSGALLIACASLVAACGGPPPRPRTVAEFVEDPTLLQGVIARCRAQGMVARDPECTNALAAAERIVGDEDAKHTGDRAATFERERAERRAREEAQRAAAERATPKFDPYTSPVANDAPAAESTAAAHSGAASPAVETPPAPKP